MKPRDKMIGENYPEFQKKWYKLQLLDTFTEVPDNQYDKTNTKVWGVLTTTQKNTIRNTFNKKVNHTKKNVKQDILKIIKLRDSLNGKRKLYKTSLEELLKKQSRNISLGFEYFLWDSLERELLKTKNEDIIFEKPGYHIDQYYSTDLTSTYKNPEGESKVIGIDLTFSNDDEILNKKKEKIDITNGKFKTGLENYSSKRTPNKTSILVINKSALKLGNNCFIRALDDFYKSGIQKGGPSIYLEKGINSKINNFSQILISIFDKIINNNFKSYTLGGNNINIEIKGNKIFFKVTKENKEFFEYIIEL